MGHGYLFLEQPFLLNASKTLAEAENADFERISRNKPSAHQGYHFC
jgi:hypothetical protein